VVRLRLHYLLVALEQLLCLGQGPAPRRRRPRLFRVEHVVGEDVVGPRENLPAAEQPPVQVSQGLRGLHELDATARL
jgi:hypothetical protein